MASEIVDRSSPFITLTTDFGTEDSYVAQIKGVIYSLSPLAVVVDCCHQIPMFDIGFAADILREFAPQFPENTIHIGIVDPGVGSGRKRIIIQALITGINQQHAKRAYFVGPDNGLFSLVAPHEARESVWKIEDLSSVPSFEECHTFDGRNIFAPVAALLSKGRAPWEFGPEIESKGSQPVLAELPERFVLLTTADGYEGSITRFDHFGNAITNIPGENFRGRSFSVTIFDLNLTLTSCRNFSDIPRNNVAGLVGSGGYIEVSACEQSARELLNLKKGFRIRASLS